MADAEDTHTASPVVDTRASVKRPAATLAQPAAAPPSSGNTGARVMKRPSNKCRLAETEAQRPASNKRGEKSGSTHTDEEHDAEAPWKLRLWCHHLPPPRRKLQQAARARTSQRVLSTTLLRSTAPA